MSVTLTCASNINWFFCVWKSPGEDPSKTFHLLLTKKLHPRMKYIFRTFEFTIHLMKIFIVIKLNRDNYLGGSKQCAIQQESSPQNVCSGDQVC